MIIEKEDTTAKLNPGEETVLLAEICRNLCFGYKCSMFDSYLSDLLN